MRIDEVLILRQHGQYYNKILAGVRHHTSSGEKDTHPDDMDLSEYMIITDIMIFYLRDSDYFYITLDIIIR